MSEPDIRHSPRHAAPDEAVTATDALERAREELAHDRRVERVLLWKGILALLFVLLVAYVRQRYFL